MLSSETTAFSETAGVTWKVGDRRVTVNEFLSPKHLEAFKVLPEAEQVNVAASFIEGAVAKPGGKWPLCAGRVNEDLEQVWRTHSRKLEESPHEVRRALARALVRNTVQNAARTKSPVRINYSGRGDDLLVQWVFDEMKTLVKELNAPPLTLVHINLGDFGQSEITREGLKYWRERKVDVVTVQMVLGYSKIDDAISKGEPKSGGPSKEQIEAAFGEGCMVPSVINGALKESYTHARAVKAMPFGVLQRWLAKGLEKHRASDLYTKGNPEAVGINFGGVA